MAVVDVIRAAVAETEDYKRVVVRTETEEVVAASAVNDMIHLLAELIENATLFSPSATKVEVRAERVANGFAIEVEDRGLGIAPDQLADLNARLASPPDFDLVDADRLGLFVAGLLAAQARRRGVARPVAVPRHQGDRAAARRARAAGQPRPTARAGRPGCAPRTRSPWSAWPRRPRCRSPGRPTAEAAGQPATTFHGLPRRVRPDKQAQPAEHDRPAAPAGSPRPRTRPRPTTRARLAASLQRSWHRSRADDEEPVGTGEPDGTGGYGGWAPDEEEV